MIFFSFLLFFSSLFIQGTSSTSTPKGIIQVSGVDLDTKGVMTRIINHLGGFKLIDKHEQRLRPTHVICGEQRTLGVLQAIARGCWLLTPEWALVSLEQERWVKERDFVATKWYPGIKARTNGHPLVLLSPEKPVFIGSLQTGQPGDVAELVRLVGGKVTTTLQGALVCLGTVEGKEFGAKVTLPPMVREKWLYGDNPPSLDL